MVRKARKSITKDLRDIILVMAQDPTNTIKKISVLLKLDRKTVRKIISEEARGIVFFSAGEKRTESVKIKNQILRPEERGILSIISCNNSLIQDEIKEHIFSEFGMMLSQPTISRKLKKLNITRKRLVRVPVERNTEQRINDRAVYAMDIAAIGNENLVFLDETGFNLHTSRLYGYSLINTKAYTNVPANRGINKSVMCAISINGVLAYECITGPYNHYLFAEFINFNLVPYFRQNPGKFLVMDNAKFHHSRDIKILLSANRIPVKYLVPYSPELNPIEEFFSMIKSRYCAIKIHSPTCTIENALNELLGSENSYVNECREFFINMRRWIEKARRKEPFI